MHGQSGRTSRRRRWRTSRSALHWNGRKWARVRTPDPGSGGNQLLGVAALSRTDAWAVGASLQSLDV